MTDVRSLLQQDISSDLKENQNVMMQILGQSIDLIRRDFVISADTPLQGTCYFIEGLASSQIVDRDILFPLMNFMGTEIPKGRDLLDFLKSKVISNIQFKKIRTIEEGVDNMLTGEAVIFFDQCDIAVIIAARGYESRSVDEPQTEPVVRGPRDGFTENIRTNTMLIRRRIRDPQLRIDVMTVGTRTKTEVDIAYIEGVVKEGLVAEVKERLSRIKIDGILESGYIEELIEDAPLSPFTTVQSTERPDKVSASLLEGRVVILIDNTPFALVVPCNFWQYFQASDDYYSRYWVGSFFRVIRFMAFFISLMLPSIYVMLVSFHHEMIPTPLALSIAAGRESVPFPALLEALVMEIAFELMREAGLRLPKPVGQAVSIVGSLVIGQAAVQAGLVSPAMVIVVALTGIASFAIPNYATSFAIRMLRFPLLLAAGFMGLLGFAGIFAIMTVHALSIRSFGESYLAPATPFVPTDQKDILIRVPWWQMKQRPQLADQDLQRESDQLMPHPREEQMMSFSMLNPANAELLDDQKGKPKDKQQNEGSEQEQDQDLEQEHDSQEIKPRKKRKIRQRRQFRDYDAQLERKQDRTWRKTQREK